jgi:hypothetical protein
MPSLTASNPFSQPYRSLQIATLKLQFDVTMGAVGAYYRCEMARMVQGHGCTYCSQPFDTDVSTDAKYPFISPVCNCTLCGECINGCLSQIVETKIFTVGCPLCRKPKAWNVRHLVPNKHLANLLHDMKRVVKNEGKDECHGGGDNYDDEENYDDDENQNESGLNDGGGKISGDNANTRIDDQEKRNDSIDEFENLARKRKK